MACDPYDPATGLFLTDKNWGTQSAGQWSFSHDGTQGNYERYVLEKGGTTEEELLIPQDQTLSVRWIFFPNDEFLAVRASTQSGNSTDWDVYIYDLRSGVSSYDIGGPWLTGGAGTPQLHFQYSSDGTAFYLWIGGDGQPNTSHDHKVFRTATGDELCSYGQLSVQAARRARITSGGDVEIITEPGSGGATVHKSCPLPQGELEITPDPGSFPEAVVGGPPGTASTTREFTLENVGADCLTVESIADAGAFQVSSTSRSLPADLDPGESMTVTVTFAPASTGSYGPTSLQVSHTPGVGDDEIRCEGSARDPTVSLGLNAGAHDFGRVRTGQDETWELTIDNTGEADLDVTVPASNSGPFQWQQLDTTIGYQSSDSVEVTFSPNVVGDLSATLTVQSNAPSSPHQVALQGEGCVAEATMGLPPANPVDFGEVERGFRTVRTLTIENTGTGPLEFDARIEGPDAGLFGLQPPSGSVTDVVTNRHYVVNPTGGNACGSVATGPGSVLLGVAFYADDDPGTVSATLRVYDHNGTGGAPAEWTVPLTAEITPPETIDVGLVLDRSGSMSDDLGARRKADATVAGGKLFTRLMRTDVGDRETVVRYNQAPDVVQAMTEVGGSGTPQADIVAKINASALSPTGSTAIAGGVLEALDELDTPQPDPPDQLGKALVVLTDGKDNTAYQDPDDGTWYSLLGGVVDRPGMGVVTTESLPDPGDVRMYGVGLGREEDIDKERLNYLSTTTGAYFGVVGGLTGRHYFDLEKYFTQIFMDAAGMEGVSDPVYTITPGEEHVHEFDVLRGDTGALVVIYDEEEGRLPFHLETPAGELVEPGIVPSGFQLRHGATDTARFVDLRVPQGKPERYAGRWKIVVSHEGRICQGDPEGEAYPAEDTIGLASHAPIEEEGSEEDGEEPTPWGRGYLPEKCRDTDDPVDYGVAIGVGSNFRMQPFLTPDTVHVGEPIHLSATVSEAGLPVEGCDVTVEARSPSGREWTLDLEDDGDHGDGDADDGEYAREFRQTAEAGGYEFTFRTVGESRDGEPVTREAVRAKYVQGRTPDDGGGGGIREAIVECCRRNSLYLRIGLILLVLIVLLLVLAIADAGPFA